MGSVFSDCSTSAYLLPVPVPFPPAYIPYIVSMNPSFRLHGAAGLLRVSTVSVAFCAALVGMRLVWGVVETSSSGTG